MEHSTVKSCSVPTSRLGLQFSARVLGRTDVFSSGLVSPATSRTDFPEERKYKRITFREAVEKLAKKRRFNRMQAGVRCAAELLQESAAREGRYYAAMVTLTYAEGVTWCQKQVAEFIQIARVWAKRRGFRLRYTWVLELTKRGRPHYHVVVWLPHGTRLPKPDRAGWWPHGMTQIAQATSPVGYLIKYASKGIGEEQSLPKGARMWGCGGLTARDRATKRYSLLPLYVKETFDEADEPARVPGGWVSQRSGEFLPGCRLVFFDGAVWIVFEGQKPRRIELC